MKELYQMLIYSLQFDATTNQPLIVLRDTESRLFLPIYIGQSEAQSILMEVEGIKPPRPMTHDLIKDFLNAFEAKVSRVIITDLVDGTFYATIHVSQNKKPLEIDSRPSDAIAIAVRLEVPIFATKQVIDKAALFPQSRAEDEKELEEFRNFLNTINPEDFKE